MSYQDGEVVGCSNPEPHDDGHEWVTWDGAVVTCPGVPDTEKVVSHVNPEHMEIIQILVASPALIEAIEDMLATRGMKLTYFPIEEEVPTYFITPIDADPFTPEEGDSK